MRKGLLAALVPMVLAMRAPAQTLPAGNGPLGKPVSTPPVAARAALGEPGVAKGSDEAAVYYNTAADVGQCWNGNCGEDNCQKKPKCFFGVDYLAWRIRSAPITTPLLTIGDAADVPFGGAIGQPGTRVLYGDDPFNFGTFNGLRWKMGAALSDCCGFESTLFRLERRGDGFAASSDAAGLPLFGRPTFDTYNNVENNYNTATPINPFSGLTSITTNSRLSGAEFNMYRELSQGSNCDNGDCNGGHCNSKRRCFLLGGIRYLDLDEQLFIQDFIYPPGTSSLTFGGAPIGAAAGIYDYDKIDAANHFYGGQLGLRGIWEIGDPLVVTVVGKIALGVTQELVGIEGASFLNSPTVSAALPGGLFAQSSNIGGYSHNVFAYVPEAQVNVGWKVTPNITATVGYSFIYWSRVARPGNQIDRNIDARLPPVSQDYANPAPPAGTGGGPTFSFKQSDFWAQGLNFGVLLSF